MQDAFSTRKLEGVCPLRLINNYKQPFPRKQALNANLEQVFQLGDESKGKIVAALVSQGLPATKEDSWEQLASYIKSSLFRPISVSCSGSVNMTISNWTGGSVNIIFPSNIKFKNPPTIIQSTSNSEIMPYYDNVTTTEFRFRYYTEKVNNGSATGYWTATGVGVKI